MRVPLTLLLSSLLLAACSSGSSPEEHSDCVTDCAPPPTGLTLVVAEASATQRQAPPGKVHLKVTFDIANGAQADAMPLGFLLFSVRTEDGLELRAVAGDDSCPSEASLLAGASRRCSVIFQTSRTATPTLLRYELPRVEGDDVSARRAEAPIGNFRPCTPCGGACVDLENDAEFCGACDVILTGSSATCVAGEPVCPDALTFCDPAGSQGPRCTDLATSKDDCGACGATVFGGTCNAGTPQCGRGQLVCSAETYTPNATQCSSSNSMESCGGCDKYCEFYNTPLVEQRCSAGRCLARVDSRYNKGRTCDAVCAQAGYDRCTGVTLGDYSCLDDFGFASVYCECQGEPLSR